VRQVNQESHALLGMESFPPLGWKVFFPWGGKFSVPEILSEDFLKEVHHLKQLKICVITSTLDTQTWGSKNRQKTENSLSGHVQSCLNMSNFLTIFLGTERHLIKDEKNGNQKLQIF